MQPEQLYTSQKVKKIETIQKLNVLFSKKINILVIDDDTEICEILVNDVFHSPLLNLVYVKTLKDALVQISDTKVNWHCWIIDVNLKEQKDGSTLLDLFPKFDYAIIFSGSSTLETASSALKKGAISAFSKDPAFLFYSDAFYNEVCKVSALSIMLKGAHNEHHQVFHQLFTNSITTVEEWARCSNLSLRQLQRICELYFPFAPRMVLPLYHSLYYLIRDPYFTENFDKPTAEDLRIQNSSDFYYFCIESVASKFDAIYRIHFVDICS
jgi:ActR/RegA family two-component response regulator